MWVEAAQKSRQPNLGDVAIDMLKGVRILDLSRVIAGPYCTRILADLGAEVIKVESPKGDAFRTAVPQKHDFSSLFTQFNAGKKSLCIDLRKEAGIQLLHRLAAQCDVFIENFRAGLAASIGAGYDDIKASNPSIVYCSISGFGQHGSDAGKPAYTDIIQALSGLDHASSQMFGNDTGSPPGFPASLADTYTSQQASIAILAALFRRQKTGEGEYIDISMLDCMISANDSTLQRYLFSEGELQGPSPIFRPPLKLKDGFLSASIGLNFEKTVQAIGLPELIQDDLFSTPELRRENMVHYIDIVSGWAADKTVEEVATLFNAHDIPYGKVRSPAEVINSKSTTERQLIVDLDLNDGNTLPVINTPFNFASGKSRPAGPPPRLGAHSREVLTELLAMSEVDIQTLMTNEIIYTGDGPA